MAVARTVWSIPFKLPQISCFTLSLKCFSSDSDNCPDVGTWPVSVLPPTEGRSSPTNTPVFPPSSFILPSFAWFYTFFSAGQVVLSTLSWCSGCTSASEVYSWCILGDRCTPRSPTPPPSCSICIYFLVLLNYLGSQYNAEKEWWKGRPVF